MHQRLTLHEQRRGGVKQLCKKNIFSELLYKKGRGLAKSFDNTWSPDETPSVTNLTISPILRQSGVRHHLWDYESSLITTKILAGLPEPGFEVRFLSRLNLKDFY